MGTTESSACKVFQGSIVDPLITLSREVMCVPSVLPFWRTLASTDDLVQISPWGDTTLVVNAAEAPKSSQYNIRLVLCHHHDHHY